MWEQYLDHIQKGDFKSLARCISLVENEVDGYENFLETLPAGSVPIIGITGPPGAGKSTLTDALIGEFTKSGKKVAVLCIDPSSPFNLGALLGDRIRMSQWYNASNVYIRSLATRGSLGGLHPKIIEISDVLKIAPFDIIIIETVGVGQSEIEIAGLADTTIVVMVPESGDEIQTMKAGLMEIADIFVVNKADRPGADMFIKNLQLMLAPAFRNHEQEIPVIKTIASEKEGIEALIKNINEHTSAHTHQMKLKLLTDKAYQLIQASRMKTVDKANLMRDIESEGSDFNIYRFIKKI